MNPNEPRTLDYLYWKCHRLAADYALRAPTAPAPGRYRLLAGEYGKLAREARAGCERLGIDIDSSAHASARFTVED